MKITSSLAINLDLVEETSDALFIINKDILDFKNNRSCLIVFFSLTKAFYSINREELYYKMEQTGIHRIVLKWLKGYLKNKSQVLSIFDWMTC